MANENFAGASTSFKIEYLKEGETVVLLPIPDNLLRLIGLVAAHWGTFEVALNKIIEASFVALGKDQPGWQRLGFTKRKKLFVDIIRTHLEPKSPDIANRYRKIAGDAADLYWRRNTVVHGLYRIAFPEPGSGYPKFWAEGTHNGNPVSVAIDEPTLESLWHGIAHLTGGLDATVNLHGSSEGWPWTFSDTELLRAYRETNHPLNPTPDRRPLQP